jgi:ABC-type nitrate/sulfonate/bicarbonate transport system substrate-binding protein
LAALTQGKIDAGIISAPVTLKARQAGLRELVDAADKNIAMIHAAFGSTRDVLRERADGVKKFLQGYVEGIKLAKSNSAEAKAVIGKYTQTSDPEELEETYRTFVRVWERAPYVSSAAVQTLLNFATNPKAKSSRPEQFIDNSLIAELENSGFIDRITKQ